MKLHLNVDKLHQTLYTSILAFAWLAIGMMMPVMFCHLFGLESLKMMWVNHVFNPLVFPALVLAAMIIVLGSIYGFGYLRRGYPGLLEYAKAKEMRRNRK